VATTIACLEDAAMTGRMALRDAWWTRGSGPDRGVDRSASAPVVRLRLAALFAAQLFDYGTFTLMVDRHGITAETNPIVAHGFASFGLPMVAIAKLALVVLVGAVIVLLGRGGRGRAATPRLAGLVAVLAVAAGLVGGLSNVIPY
jgi:hypothetical protein